MEVIDIPAKKSAKKRTAGRSSGKVTKIEITECCPDKKKDWKCDHKHGWKCHHKHAGGCGYFLGFLGAAVYYIQTATGFWDGVLGFLKAIVWPAFLVHGLLKFLGL